MIEELGPLDKQWLKAGLGNIAEDVCRVARDVTDWNLPKARYWYLAATETALLLTRRFPEHGPFGVDAISLSFVVNGETIPISVPLDTPLGVARDMAIARSEQGREGAVWEMCEAGKLLLGCDTLHVRGWAPGTEFFVTFPIGVGA